MQFYILHIPVFQLVAPVKGVKTYTAISKGMEVDDACHTFSHVLGTTTRGEVSYMNGKVWLCLQCHLMERELKQIKGKGNVKRILQQCGQCAGGSAVAGDRTPAWFCHGCHQYLCTQCERNIHHDLRDHVRC